MKTVQLSVGEIDALKAAASMFQGRLAIALAKQNPADKRAITDLQFLQMITESAVDALGRAQ